jgi:hypothetical protein
VVVMIERSSSGAAMIWKGSDWDIGAGGWEMDAPQRVEDFSTNEFSSTLNRVSAYSANAACRDGTSIEPSSLLNFYYSATRCEEPVCK